MMLTQELIKQTMVQNMFRNRITIFTSTFRSLIKLKDYIHGARQAFSFIFLHLLRRLSLHHPTNNLSFPQLAAVSYITFLYTHRILTYNQFVNLGKDENICKIMIFFWFLIFLLQGPNLYKNVIKMFKYVLFGQRNQVDLFPKKTNKQPTGM